MPPLPRAVDALVIGGGPNGLVSATLLADAGWSVLLLEAHNELGGAVKSRMADGWIVDRFSSCYPLAKASPILRELDLHEHGLSWASAATVLAHPLGSADVRGAMIHADREVTAANLAEENPADGEAWLRLCEQYELLSSDFLDALLTSWPPVGAAGRLARTVGGAAEFLRLARFLSLPAYRMGEELFQGDRGRALLAGNAMHADAPLVAPVSGMMGWLMAMLAQSVGFPSPVGGAVKLTDALASRARAAGAELVTGEPVVGIDVRRRKAVGVRTASGHRIAVGRAVIADTSATSLYRELLAEADLPQNLLTALDKFEWDLPTVKVNYRLRSTPGWVAEHARNAGVVHLGGDAGALARCSTDLVTGQRPTAPFVVIGQTSTIDSTRSPQGAQALWAYSHLPRQRHDDAAAYDLASRLDVVIERHAPGFRELIIERDVQTPDSLAAEDANLVHGAIGGGTSQAFQQLMFRPLPGAGGARTVVQSLYLGSAASHPGAGVHGACGALAARAARADHARLGPIRRRAASVILDRLYPGKNE